MDRKNFIKNCAALFLGEKIFPLIKLWAQESYQNPNFRSYLSFLDFELMNKTYREASQIGNPDLFIKIGNEVFRPNMELMNFTRAYLVKLKDQTGISSRILSMEKITNVLKIIKFNQGALALIHSLFLIYRNRTLENFNDRITSSWISQKNYEQIKFIKDFYASLINIRDEANVTASQNLIEYGDRMSERIFLLDLGIDSKDVKPFPFFGINFPKKFLKFRISDISRNYLFYGQSRASNKLSRIDTILKEIEYTTYQWQKYFFRFSFYELFRNFYKKIDKGEEEMVKDDLVTSGKKRLVQKILLSSYFMEIILTRIQTIAEKSLSGIFNSTSRNYMQLEVASLVSLAEDIISLVKFRNTSLFPPGNNLKEVRLNINGKSRKVKIPNVDCFAFELKNIRTRKKISIQNTLKSFKVCNDLEKNIQKLKTERKRFLESLG